MSRLRHSARRHRALGARGEPGRDPAPLAEELLEAVFYKQIPMKKKKKKITPRRKT